MAQILLKKSQWYDVQDQKGVWRLAKCVKQQNKNLLMRLDGWSHKYEKYYCEHSNRIAPARKYTKGYTTQQPFPLRQPLQDFQIIVNTSTKLKLFLNSDLLAPDIIQERIIFFRVQLFVLVDSILTLPFDFHNPKQGLQVNKLFMQIVNLGIKILNKSEANLKLISTAPQNASLHSSTYEIIVMLKSVFGLSNRYHKFYKNDENMFIRKQNCIDCFLKSPEGGILLINTYLKNIINNNLCAQEDFDICSELILILLELFSGGFLTEQYSSSLQLLIETITNYLKFAVKNDKVYQKFKAGPNYKYILNTFENMYIKLKPKKKLVLDFLNKEENKKKNKNVSMIEEVNQNVLDSKLKKPDLSKANLTYINSLQQRILRLQKQREQDNQRKQRQKEELDKHFEEIQKKRNQNKQIKIDAQFDFNQLSFLSLLQFHFANGDTETIKKLVNWRKKIIQLSVIVGWDIALLIAKHTQEKLTIDNKDILSINIAYLKQNYNI